MDMVAAIQAAKNQLEAEKKKKGINTTIASSSSTALPSISPLHPAPPTNIVSFDAKKSAINPPHPYHANQAEYIHPDFQYKSNIDQEDDELTTTSSLSGTLPSSVIHDIPHSIHKNESTRLAHSGLLETVNESTGSNSHPMLRSKSFVDTNTTSPEMIDYKDITSNQRSKSLYAKDPVPMPGLPIKKSGNNSHDDNKNIALNETARANSSADQSILNSNNTPGNNNATSTSSKENNVSKQFDEIMSAYQGKVNTILKRRDDGTSFKAIIETASAQGSGSNDVSSSISKRSSEGIDIDDIISTYQKKVGEIMEKKQQALNSTASSNNSMSSKITYDDDMELRRQEISARSKPSYPRSIVDDETTESREGAIDKSVGGSHASRGNRSTSPHSRHSRSDSRRSSYSSSRSDSDNESCSEDGSRGGTKNRDSMSNNWAKSIPTEKTAGLMSNRAHAISKGLDTKQTSVATSSRSPSPSQNRGGVESTTDEVNEDNKSLYSRGSHSSHSTQSYISGASFASQAMGSTNSRDYTEEGQLKDSSTANMNNNISKSNDEIPAYLVHRDSLRLAQEQLSCKLPQSTKSFYCEPNSTKSNLHAEIEIERKRRQDLEKSLAESTQREEDLLNKNCRIEKTLTDLQSQLDKVQGDARSNKFLQSEQAARVRELERKLQGEQNRVEELEREKEAIKEEYDADLEEQKDINRQLEQMVMSEEFEKELEDEINQVKELEHANRRFKVKIDMLEREKTTLVKKFEVKIDDLNHKNKTLENQLSEFESKSNALETSNRNIVMELEAKLATETSRVRELELSTDSAASNYNSKLKTLEAEIEELHESSAKIQEYEQVLGKLMERNAELEAEAKEARDERDMANRQIELSDRRKAVKVKDLQEQVAEQKLTIEQQQETLEESVKTILKLYSLNNDKGDDMTELSEEQLNSITRAMIPGSNIKASLPPLSDRPERPWSLGRNRFDDEIEKSVTRAVDRARSRGRDRFGDLGTDNKTGARGPSRGRDRLDEMDTDKSVSRSMARARSQGRDRFEDIGLDRTVARANSRGRGDRSESIRQLTSRALDRNKSRSPMARRHSSSEPMYDNSLALVPVTPKESDDRYIGYSRRGGSDVYDRIDSTYTEGSSFSTAIIPYNEYDSRDRRHRNSYHQPKSRYDERSRGDDRRRERDRGDRRERDERLDDRNREVRSHREHRHRDRDRDNRGPRRYDGRHRSSQGGYHAENYGSRRAPRDPSLYGDVIDERPHNHDRRRSRNGPQNPHAHIRDP